MIEQFSKLGKSRSAKLSKYNYQFAKVKKPLGSHLFLEFMTTRLFGNLKGA